MLLRTGAVAAALLFLASGMPTGVAMDESFSAACATVSLATHRSSTLKIDLWLANVEWGPGGLTVDGERIPFVPGLVPPGQWPDPPVAPDDEGPKNLVGNGTGDPDDPLPQFQPLLDHIEQVVRTVLGDVFDTQITVVHVMVQLPRLHPDYLPEGVRVGVIVDYRSCLPP